MIEMKVGDIWEHEEWQWLHNDYALALVRYLLLEDRGTNLIGSREFLVRDLNRNQTYEMVFNRTDMQHLKKVG